MNLLKPILRGRGCLCVRIVGLAGLLAFSTSANPIVTENALAGNPSSEWDVVGDGDDSIQGFATSMSVNKGETIQFKVKTTATSYQIKIYRMGYYNGNGARFITNVLPSVSLPQSQPNPLTNSATGLVDCGNWAVSASWTVPTNLCSGLYLARPTRADTQGASHILFVVRDDHGGADMLFQTSDTTWQAYNTYGGNSLYGLYHINGWGVNRAYKASYNRPLTTRETLEYYSLWIGEVPMIRWLEANGYNISYISGVDTHRYGSQLTNNHKVFLSVGHDEYWSAQQRANVTAARNAGLHLAFFSGNEMFWKIRWENSIDGSNTPYRTMVCYKETTTSAKIDPSPEWTGTWRDPRFSPPSDGNFPENEITGTLFVVNGIATNSLEVPADYGKHRVWRNTTVASLGAGQKAVFPKATLGFEWDAIVDNGFLPAGQMRLSLTTAGNLNVLQDYGSTYQNGSATHSLSLYRHQSGALVFGAGTVQWPWGLDNTHAPTFGASEDDRMKQATVNLFADMGAQPGSLRPGLTAASASTDFTAPVSSITNVPPGTMFTNGATRIIAGTGTDSGGGLAWGVEVSTDNGMTWHPATGRTNWTYQWTPRVNGAYTIRSRAVDDSGNLESPSTGVAVTVTNPPFNFGTVGNTVDGNTTDDIFAVSPYINANRYQAASNMLVSAIRAKVGGVTGSYKCAIYADNGNGSVPTELIQSTLAVTNPTTGWRTFPLNSLTVISNGTFYWLAVWSDATNAKVYLSGTGAPLRWGLYGFNDWPKQIVTTGSGSASYCIYATGGAAPVFNGTPTNRTIAELTSLSVTNAATDADTAPQSLLYSLLNAPSNAVISPAGVIAWTPSEAQGPSTNNLITRVTDGTLSATNTFQVIVSEVNSVPAFTATPSNRTAVELTPLTVTNAATDTDVPSQALTYQLLSPPSNAVINASGIITWTPSAAQGPSTNNLVTRVTDGALAATNSFQVIVLDANAAPVAFGQSLTNAEDTNLSILLTVSDPDGPTTNYVITAPPTHGTLSGTAPNLSYLPSTNYFGPDSFAFRVHDGSLTSSVASVSILLTNINDAPMLPALADIYTGVYNTVVASNAGTDVDSAPSALAYSLLSAGGATISTNGEISWLPKSGPQTNLITSVVTDNGTPALSATNSLLVIVTNSVERPFILSLVPDETNAVLTWTSISNAFYRVQFLDDFSTANWTDSTPDVGAVGDTASATNDISGQPARFYRVVLLP